MARKSNKIKGTLGDRISGVVITVVLLIYVFTTIYPFWHVLMYSISDSKAAMTGGLFFLPRDFSLVSYKMLIQTKAIFNAFFNSLAKTVVGTALGITLSALTAYPLSRENFKGKGLFTSILFFTMLFSGGMIPLYIQVKDLGLIDNFGALVLPGAMSVYNTFILRNYFESIPASLEESAVLDGANHLQIFSKVIIPLSMPVLAAVTMFYLVDNWNSYIDGVLYINTNKLQILQVYLRTLLGSAGAKGALGDLGNLSEASKITEDTMKMTTIAVSVIPVLIVYPFLQKYYTKGIMIGAVKG